MAVLQYLRPGRYRLTDFDPSTRVMLREGHEYNGPIFWSGPLQTLWDHNAFTEEECRGIETALREYRGYFFGGGAAEESSVWRDDRAPSERTEEEALDDEPLGERVLSAELSAEYDVMQGEGCV